MTAGDLQTLIGHHNGTFTALTRVTGDPNAQLSLIQCAAADVDGDGKVDLVFAQAGDNYPDGVGDGGFIIAKGHGDGTFDALTFPLGGAAFFFGGLSLADVNGDGKVDILSLNSSAGAITVSLNNGSGGFASAVQYAVNRGPTTITLGDFNGDGKPDIASGEPHGLSVLLNLGGGVYRAPVIVDAGETAAAAVAIDLNRDGIVDIAEISNSQAFRDPYGEVYAFLGNPKASFTSASAEAGLQDIFLMAVTDFNRDGFTDVCYVDFNQELQIETYSSTQRFVGGWPVVDLPSQPNAIVAGDFNGDGEGDIAFTDGSSLQVMLGVGDGTFSAAQQYTVGNNPVSLAIRDVNGDGKSDLLVVNQGSNDVSVLLGNGNGTFQAEHHFLAGTSPNVMIVGDFNRDNKIDLAVANGTNVAILLGNGDGTFEAFHNFAAGGASTSISQASFEVLGTEDIVVGAGQSFFILPGNGDGTFQAPILFSGGSDAGVQAITGDFNGDGAPDLALYGPGVYGHNGVL